MLHVELDNSLFIVVDSWLPGRGVRPHHHGTWAVVDGVKGTERNVFWERTDGGSRPGHDETPLSFHVYGKHLNYTDRSHYDTDTNLQIPFKIEIR